LQKVSAGGAAVFAPHIVQTRNPDPAAAFHFHGLTGMPCGCVAVAYRSFQWSVGMVSLEAKGPHCVLAGHEVGRVLEMNDLFEDDSRENDGLEF
jgi:hypothetical protein